MKKVSLLLVIALMLFTALIFVSCDQETVDSTRSEIMDACVELLGPYLEEATETTSSSQSTTDSSTTDSSTIDSVGTVDSSIMF